MKAFDISLFAAAAALLLIAFLLKHPASKSLPVPAQPVRTAAVVEIKPAEPEAQTAAMPPAPAESVMPAAATQKAPTLPTAEKTSPKPIPIKSIADATPPSPPKDEPAPAKQ